MKINDFQRRFHILWTGKNTNREIYGNFKAGRWGTFKTYFKFHQNQDGKFDRLDIGQSDY